MFTYSPDFDPPAPCLQITLRHLAEPARTAALTAQVDTGADLTAVPQGIIDSLELPDAGDLLVAGYDGRSTRAPVYYLSLTVAGHTFDLFRVVATPIDQALLGRDALNHFYTRLSGPDLTFDLTTQA